MDGEREALELDEARVEDSVHCEGCGEAFDVAEIVESPYEADDGGAYCIECAQREWARAVEEATRYKEALQQIGRLADRYDPNASDVTTLLGIRDWARAALAGTGVADAR